MHWSYYGFKNYHLIDMTITSDSNVPLILNIFNSNLYRGFRYCDIPYSLKDYVKLDSTKKSTNKSRKSKVPEFVGSFREFSNLKPDQFPKNQNIQSLTEVDRAQKDFNNFFKNHNELKQDKPDKSLEIEQEGSERELLEEEIIEQSKCDLVLEIRTNFNGKNSFVNIYKKLLARVSVYKNFRLVLKSNFISKQNFMGNTEGMYHESDISDFQVFLFQQRGNGFEKL